MTDPFEEAREKGRRFREHLGTPRVYDIDSDGQLVPIDIGMTLRDAQNDVVLSLLPRTHDVAIEGRHIGAGTLVPLRLDYRQLAGEWRLRP